LQNQDLTTRTILALILSVIIISIYDYFFMPKNMPVKENNITVTKEAPKIKEEAISIPKAKVIKEKVIAKVESDKYILTIDKLGRINSLKIKEGNKTIEIID